MASDKNVQRPVSGPLSGLLAVLLAAGCAAPEGGGADRSNDRRDSSTEVREPRSYTMDDLNAGAGGGDALDFGEDWIDAAGGETPGRLPAGAPGGPQGTGLPGNRTSVWTVLLGTYTSLDHEQAAATMAGQVTNVDPRLASAWVHTTGKGSMVVFGAFDEVDAPQAQETLVWIKELAINGRLVFPRASLIRVRANQQRVYQPHELMSVRVRFPNVSPLYTVQVAAWGDYGGGGEVSLEEIQRDADAYARALRGRGYPAYVHHDEALRLSMVTIGVFDQSAIDTQSGIHAPEVERILRTFPDHLVNGEPLLEYVDRKQPHLGTRAQPSRLVLVPDI